MFDQKKWSTKTCIQRIFGPKEMLAQQIYEVQPFFWNESIFGPKQNVGQKICLVKNSFAPKNSLLKKNVSNRGFGPQNFDKTYL